jgi:hypothetical protein
MAMVWEPSLLQRLTERERAQAVRLLARLLLEASGMDHEEAGDEDV